MNQTELRIARFFIEPSEGEKDWFYDYLSGKMSEFFNDSKEKPFWIFTKDGPVKSASGTKESIRIMINEYERNLDITDVIIFVKKFFEQYKFLIDGECELIDDISNVFIIGSMCHIYFDIFDSKIRDVDNDIERLATVFEGKGSTEDQKHLAKYLHKLTLNIIDFLNHKEPLTPWEYDWINSMGIVDIDLFLPKRNENLAVSIYQMFDSLFAKPGFSTRSEIEFLDIIITHITEIQNLNKDLQSLNSALCWMMR